VIASGIKTTDMHPFQLSIPKPCNEDWERMTATEQGRFCNACAKEVVDFSKMSDKEVLNYFFTIKDQNVCGRALPTQLERDIVLPKDPVKTKYWYWNYITLLFLFFNKSSAAKIHGGVSIHTSQPVFKSNLSPKFLLGKHVGNPKRSTRMIAGKITNEQGKGISAAIVKIKGNHTIIKADKYGVYSINVDILKDTLEVSAIGHLPKDFILANVPAFNFVLTTNMVEELQGKLGGIRISTPVQQHSLITHIAKIIGTIKDAEGNPIPFATIKIKGSNTATIANAEGVFTIQSKGAKSIVEISAVGFKAKEFVLDTKAATQDIILEAGIKTLEGVVVTAYPQHIKGSMSQVISGNMSVKGIRATSLSDTLKSFFSLKKSAVKIFPNPVAKGNTFSLSLQLHQTGNHYLQICDATGRIVLQQPLQASTKQYNQTIQTGQQWGTGIFYLRLYNPANTLMDSSSFLVE
jgi:hypothetical protein